MDIKLIYGAQKATKARGLTVVIDVFRAFSTACYLMDQGAEVIIPLATPAQAYHLKKEHPQYILVGEQHGAHLPGFDFGNSPWELKGQVLTGKTVVQVTTMGTRGLVQAVNAQQIITGSFVNIGAIIRYIKSQQPRELSLLCTGSESPEQRDEDTECANYIKNSLKGKANDFESTVEYLQSSPTLSYFFDSKVMSHPEEDFWLCLKLDRFNFVISKRIENGVVVLKKLK